MIRTQNNLVKNYNLHNFVLFMSMFLIINLFFFVEKTKISILCNPSEGHNGVYEKVKNLDKSLLQNGLLGINLGKNKSSNNPVYDYELGIQKFFDIADYFVINVSR